jgi:L-ascorbate metabolism protein UlaG (beta-lactamase superfamily)
MLPASLYSAQTMHNQITYVGHATVLLELDGVRLLTDPLLRDRAFYLHRRSQSVKTSSYQDIDLTLISHLHLDHFDLPSLRMLGRGTRLVVPHGAANLLHKKRFNNVMEMRSGDETTVGALSIKATHAEHHSIYPPFGPTTDCLGYLIRGSQSVYFPGDTDLFPGMADLADDLDVALLPVWGWGPNLGPGHMNPQRAAEALKLLRPRIAIPIHWGSFYPRGLGWLRSHLMVEPPQLFQQAASRLMPQVEIHILTPGSSLIIS